MHWCATYTYDAMHAFNLLDGFELNVQINLGYKIPPTAKEYRLMFLMFTSL